MSLPLLLLVPQDCLLPQVGHHQQERNQATAGCNDDGDPDDFPIGYVVVFEPTKATYSHQQIPYIMTVSLAVRLLK